MELEFGKVSSDVFSNVENGVKLLLQNNQSARDDDMVLAFMYWKEIQRIDIPQEIIDKIVKHGISYESISR